MALLVGIENPLLDIMTEVDAAFLERYVSESESEEERERAERERGDREREREDERDRGTERRREGRRVRPEKM